MPRPGQPHKPYSRTRPPSPTDLDRRQAARFLGVSERTVERWSADGRLSSFLFGGSRWWPRGALQAAMDEARTGVQRF